MKTLIIIPAHNEAKNIGSLVKNIIEAGHDVVVIDDGSLDDTAILAKTQGAVVISTHQKSGKGHALRLGFAMAVEKDYEAVVTMDGDGQHAVSDLAHFIECQAKSHADIVNGNRMENTQSMPWLRRMTNRFMSWMISLVCRQAIADTQCGFRLITTKVLKAVTFKSDHFEIETEILVKASRHGFKISSVGIQTIYRDEVSKIRPFTDTLRFIRYLIKEMFSS